MPAKHTPGPWKQEAGAILTSDTSPANPRPCIALLSTAWRSEQYVANGLLIAAAPDLLAELVAAHCILRNALQIMTIEQKTAWGRLNEAAGIAGEGVTRYHERATAIASATSTANFTGAEGVRCK
jgi:hypothetical protein